MKSSRKLRVSDYVADECARGCTLEEAISEVAMQLGVSPGWVRNRLRRDGRKSGS